MARYYFKRGAWVAAAQRAKARDRAVRRRAGHAGGAADPDRFATTAWTCTELATQSREVYAANYPGEVRLAQAEVHKSLVEVLVAAAG